MQLPAEPNIILKIKGNGEQWQIGQLPENKLVLIYQAHEPTGDHLGISIANGLEELLALHHVCLPRSIEQRLTQILDQPQLEN